MHAAIATSNQHPLLLVLLLLFLFPRPCHTRRGQHFEQATKTSTFGSRGWSSSGVQGMEQHHSPYVHHPPKPVQEVVVVSHTSQKNKLMAVPPYAIEKDNENIDHPSRAFLEHHPYASGVFTFDAMI